MAQIIDTPLTRAHMNALQQQQLAQRQGVDFDLPSENQQSLASILGMFGKSAPQQGASPGEVFPGVQNIDPQSGTGRPEGVGGTFGSGGFLDRFLSGGQNTGTIAGAFQSGLMGGDQFRAQRASQRALSEKVADLKLRQLEAETKALERPTDRKIIKDVQGVNRFLDTGEKVFEGATPKEELGAAGGVVTAENQSGARRNFDLGDATDRKEFIEGGYRKLPSRVEQDVAGSFEGPRGKLQIEINEQAAAVNAYGARANRLLGVISDGGNTLTASMANVGNRVFNDVKTFTKTFGTKFESADPFNPANYDGAFSAAGLAGASARAKNGFLGLAIQKAIASGLGTGKALSDQDIKNQLISLGQSQSDPDIVRQLFTDDFLNLSEGVNFRAQSSGLTVPTLTSPDFMTPGVSRDSKGGLVIDLTQ